MTTSVSPVSPELRTQIIAAIKGGMPVAQAAETHQLSPKTIGRWMREISRSTNAAATELQKARKRIVFLETTILDLVLEQKEKTYHS